MQGSRKSVLGCGRIHGLSAAMQVLCVLSLLSLVGAAPCRAQATDYGDDANLLEINGVNTTAVPPRLVIAQLQTADSAAPPAPPQTGTANPNDGWHFAVSPYLWFPGVHGTATGPNGRGLSLRASPGDLLSNFRFGLMGAVEASRNHLVITGDLLWIRLEDNKAVPFPGLAATSATIKASEFFLTPKVGLRLINHEKIKIDALTGLRYWHLGENLKFNPSLLGLNFSGSQDFVDPLVGGRIETADTNSTRKCFSLRHSSPLLPVVSPNSLKSKSSRGVIFNATTAGVVFGITLNLK